MSDRILEVENTGPDPELMRTVRALIEQNRMVLDMNARLLERLSAPAYHVVRIEEPGLGND